MDTNQCNIITKTNAYTPTLKKYQSRPSFAHVQIEQEEVQRKDAIAQI